MRLEAHQLKAMTAHKASGLPAETFVMPAPVPKKKRDNEEFRIQSAFFRLWRANCARLGVAPCMCFHIPNGSVMGGGNAEWQKKERAIRGRLQKLAGVMDGVVDVFLSIPAKGFHGFYIEFKKPGGTATPEQESFAGYAITHGYKCEVHDNAAQAWAAVESYLAF